MLHEPLATFVTRFAADSQALERQLTCPVLLYRPAEGPQTSSEYRMRTDSGVDELPTEPGAPVILQVRKAKDNAFRRGITVGRTANNDLVLDDSSVSRFHAWFQQEEGGVWQVADAGSRNGTKVLGERLRPKKAVPLTGETKIRFGKIEVTFLPPQAFLRLLRHRVGS